MKTKKILSLLVVLSVIAQMFGLLPVVNAAGDIPSEVAVVDVSSLKDSYVTAGAFTNDGMVDVAAEMTTGYIVPKTVTAGTAPSYNAELKRYEGNFASTGSVNYYRLPFDSAVRRDQISKSNKFTNGGYTIESYFKIQNAAGANNGIFDAAFGGGFGFETTEAGNLAVYSRKNGAYIKNGSAYPGETIALLPDTYYHIVATITPTQVLVYCNGELKETVTTTEGDLYWPSNTKAPYGAVFGGNYSSTDGKLSGRMDGNIVFGNVYNKPLSAEEVTAAYGDIVQRKTLTKVGDLNTALANIATQQATDFSEELEKLNIEGWSLMNNVGLTDAKINTYLAKVQGYTKKDFAFPLVYDASNMPFQYVSPIDLSKYGISTKGIWSPQKVNNPDSRNFDGLRFSVASSSKPASPLTAMDLKFANDKVHNPTPLTGDNYILETEYTTWLHGAENIDLLFNGKSSDGTEKTFGKIRVNKPIGATAPIGAKIYVTDNADVKVQNERPVLASMKAGTGAGAGDLIYVKSEINLRDHTFSAWAVPRMSEDGSYVETPASDANLLAKDVPFFDNTITEFSGVSFNVLASAPTINYSCGAWLRNLSVKPNTYTVTGVKDINVTGVKLKQGTLEYDGAISGENVTFTNVLSGTYDVVATYASGYEASGLATLTVVVPNENMTGLNFTSRAISATAKEVSGITDANVKTADLYNAEQLVAIGKFNTERTNVSFGKVEPGTYTIKTTYNDGYVAAADADTTVTVVDTAITNLKITSLKALYTVSGTIDKYIDSVKLKTTGKEYVGVLDRTLNTVTFNDVADGTYTIETTREQNYTNSPTSTTSVTVNGASLPTAMTLTSTAPADGITLRMAVLSDTQYGRGGLGVADHSRAHFINAMAKMKEKVGGTWDNLDVLLIPGDITHNSYINEYQAFVEDLQTALPYGSHTKVLFLRGNHDAKEGNNAGASTTRLSNFVTELSKYDPTLKSPNNITNVNGYQFVTVSQDTQKGNDEPSTNEYIMAHNYLHSPETVSWFTQTMTDAAAQSNGKPIFVGMHPNAYEKIQANTITAENGTVFGSYPINGYKNQTAAKSDYWATSELYNAIKPHSNAVTFSGHSHWTVANESSIHQRDFTSMNTGAVNNMEIENAWDESFQPNRLGFANENESNGYFITVNTEQKINVERMDLARANSKLGEDWNFNPLDKTSWKYTADRDKVAPTFGLGATVTVTDIGEQTCKIGFDQATDNVDVNNYTVEIIDKSTGVVVKKYTPSAFYWMQTVPLKNEWIATDLLPGNTYTAKVTAYDTFGNASATSIESAEFKTTERAVTPSAITDISFTNDGIQDTSEFARFYGIKPIKHGTVPMTYNNDIKMYEGNFARNAGDTNSPNFFKVLFDAQRKALMQTGEGYTIDLMFKQSALQTDNNIIGAAQSGGFDIETDATGVLSSCVRHGGAWVGGSSKPGSNITTVKDTYYHITLTYDGFNVKVYKDGVLTDTKPASGAIEFTDIMSADGFYGMVIGGDYNPTGTAPAYTDQENAQNAFSGNITFAKVYNSALTQSEITKKVSALNARKNLTKIDALNTMLTVTLPAAKLGGENAYVDKLLSEGWKIMNSETLTDEEITAFLTKAENTTSYTMPYSFDAKNVEFASGTNAVPFAKYGFTANTSNVLWSVLKMNDISSVYSDAVRFSTRSNIGDKEIMRLTFAKDTVGNPEAVKFNGKNHTYESEFSFRYQTGGEGYMTLDLNGKDATDTESSFAQLKFAPVSGKDGTVTLVDKTGNPIGKTLNIMNDDGDGHAMQVFYLKVDINLENNTYSAWIIPRKTATGPYTGNSVGDANLLVRDQAFNNANIKEFSSISYAVTKSTATNGVWLNNVRISGDLPVPVGDFGAKITTNLDDILTNRTGNVKVDFTNPKLESKNMMLFFAVYGINGDLQQVITDKKTVAAATDVLNTTINLSSAIDLPADQIKEIKVFAWDENLISYDKVEKILR